MKKLTFGWSRGAIAYNWFKTVDFWDGKFGMVDIKHYPKAVMLAYAALVRQLHDLDYLKEWDLGEGRYAFIFGDDSRTMIVSWTEEDDMPEALYALKITGNSEAKVIDLMGNETRLTSHRNRVLLTVKHEPSYFEIQHAGSLRAPSQALLEFPERVVASPGSPLKIPYTVHSPFAQSVKLDIGFLADSQLVEGSSKETAAYKLNDAINGAFQLSVSSDGFFNESIRSVDIFVRLDKALSGKVRIPVLLMKSIPQTGFGQRPPDFVLDQRVQTTNQFENNPGTRHLQWQGPKDLSAAIHLRRDKWFLFVQVDVIDDSHVPLSDPEDMNSGDHVRLFFCAPQNRHKGWWEIDLATGPDGNPVLSYPKWDYHYPPKNLKITAEISPITGGMRYTLKSTLPNMGLKNEIPDKGLMFNAQVGDRDEAELEGFIRLSPATEPLKYPMILLKYEN